MEEFEICPATRIWRLFWCIPIPVNSVNKVRVGEEVLEFDFKERVIRKDGVGFGRILDGRGSAVSLFDGRVETLGGVEIEVNQRAGVNRSFELPGGVALTENTPMFHDGVYYRNLILREKFRVQTKGEKRMYDPVRLFVDDADFAEVGMLIGAIFALSSWSQSEDG